MPRHRAFGQRPIAPIAEALALACLASICAYAVDSGEVLRKVYFGVPNPYQMTFGAKHTLNLWEGSPYSQLPRPATWRWLEPLLAFS